MAENGECQLRERGIGRRCGDQRDFTSTTSATARDIAKKEGSYVEVIRGMDSALN
jgi:hypothetical protein